MDLSPALPEMLICSADARRQRSADARRQVVARDGGTNSGLRFRPSYAGLTQKEKRRYRRLDIAETITSPRRMLRRIRQQSFLRKF